MKSEVITQDVSRRNFFTGLGVVGATAAVALAADKAYAAEEVTGEVLPQEALDGKKIFRDVDLAIGHIIHNEDKCCGCRDCEIICSLNKFGVVNSELSNIRINTDILGGYISDAELCKQCPGAECVAVCPTGANHVDENTGARVIDPEVCIGCRLCENACPVEPSRIHFSADRGICFKCDLCGGDPLCVAYCSNAALTCSWLEAEDDGNTIMTSANIPLTIALSGAVLVVAPEAVEILDLDAAIVSRGIQITGKVASTYSSEFEAKIKTSFFDADGQVLYFSDRSVVTVDVNSIEAFEDFYETTDPDACKSMRIEIMCGKIAG